MLPCTRELACSQHSFPAICTQCIRQSSSARTEAGTRLDQAAADAANVLLGAPNAADVLLSAADATNVLLREKTCLFSMHASRVSCQAAAF